VAIENLQDLFVHTLRDIYFAEQTILRKLPKMIDKAASTPLRSVLETHLAETHEHATRLEQVFSALGEAARGDECPAIEGITEEADELIDEIEHEDTRDAAMLAAAQAVEHYEISCYGTLIAWAAELDHAEIGKMLQPTLDEEKATDVKLTQLAEARLNRKAA
jgi:ferritin-like metal-binding protein YciE